MELELIQNKIHEIRNRKVMLDFDLAEMYQVETRVLNQAVKRNIKRFPDDFMFQLTKAEWDSMSSQFVMTYPLKRPKSALPFVFTEQGVAMLSSVLRSETAIVMNIGIMRAFVAVRNLVLNPPADRIGKLENEMLKLKEYIEEAFTDYNDVNEDTRMQLDPTFTPKIIFPKKQEYISVHFHPYSLIVNNRIASILSKFDL